MISSFALPCGVDLGGGEQIGGRKEGHDLTENLYTYSNNLVN